MQITSENIGNTLCLYETAKHIRILDVNPQYVFYATEDGYHYGTKERSVDALLVTDPTRLAVFEENYSIGKILNAAEYKAFEYMFSDSETERTEANSVLSTIRAQQKHLNSRLDSDRAKMVPGETLATQFLSQLSELSSGSHDTFWGHKVQLVSNWSYEFQIDGKTMDFDSAVAYLSKAHYMPSTKKMSLNDVINAANIKRETDISTLGKEHDSSVPER